jgi:hypothetical protein
MSRLPIWRWMRPIQSGPMRQSAHQIVFGPADRRHVGDPRRCIAADDEFIQLRRGNRGRGQHGMHLTTVVGLVLEKMRHQIVHPVMLLGLATVHDHGPGQRCGWRCGDQRQQPRIAVPLSCNKCCEGGQTPRLLQRGAVKSVAFQCIDVETIHQQNVVERGTDRREEACARGGVIFARQPGAGGMQSVVGKVVHLRQFAPDAAGVG